MSDISAIPTAELVNDLIQQESVGSEINGELLSAFNGYVTALSVIPATEFADRIDDIQYCEQEYVEGSDGEVVVDNYTLISKEVPIAETDKQFALLTPIQIPVHRVPNPQYESLDEVPADVLTESIAEAQRLDIYIFPQSNSDDTGSADLLLARSNDTRRPISVSYRDKTPASPEHVVLATRLLSLGTTALKNS
jgi:hypothetical protein